MGYGSKRGTKKVCKYSASCFDCPLKDCKVNAGNVNEILSGDLYQELVGRNKKSNNRVEECLEKKNRIILPKEENNDER